MSDNLKDIFRQHADFHESPVDPNEIWEGILKKRQEPKKRRVIYIIPFLCLLFIGSILVLNNDLSEVKEYSSETTPNTQTQESGIIVQPEEELLKANLSSSAKTIEKQITTTKIISSLLADNNAQKQISTFNNNIQKTTTSPSEKNTTYNRNSFITKNSKPQLILKNATNISTTSILDKKEMLSITPRLSLIQLNLFSSPTTVRIDNKILPLPKKKRRPSVSIEFAASALSKTLHSVDPILLSLAEEKKLYEKPIDSYSARLAFNLPIFKNFSADLGIDYSRMYEKFEWSGTYMRNEFGDIIPINSYDAEGTPLFNYTNGVYFEEINNSISNYNRYETIDIPVSISYDIQTFAQLSFRLTAGYSFNVSDQSNGFLFTEENVPSNLEDSQAYPTLSSSPFAKMHVSYPLFSRTSINLGMDLRYRRMTERTTAWTYRSLGAYIGLRMDI